MHRIHRIHRFAALLLAGFLAGCGNDNAGNVVGPTIIQGKVVSDEGPVRQAVIQALDAQGRVLSRLTLQGDPHFRIPIPADAAYPVVLSARFDADKTLEAVVTSSLAVEQDITPYSDLVVKSARTLGGLTPENIARAAGGAIGQRGQRTAGFAAEAAAPPSGPRLKRSSGGDHGH
ncbi:hypothetical protein JCM13664_16520 [Methylothermus subterraneus]